MTTQSSDTTKGTLEWNSLAAYQQLAGRLLGLFDESKDESVYRFSLLAVFAQGVEHVSEFVPLPVCEPLRNSRAFAVDTLKGALRKPRPNAVRQRIAKLEQACQLIVSPTETEQLIDVLRGLFECREYAVHGPSTFDDSNIRKLLSVVCHFGEYSDVLTWISRINSKISCFLDSLAQLRGAKWLRGEADQKKILERIVYKSFFEPNPFADGQTEIERSTYQQAELHKKGDSIHDESVGQMDTRKGKKTDDGENETNLVKESSEDTVLAISITEARRTLENELENLAPHIKLAVRAILRSLENREANLIGFNNLTSKTIIDLLVQSGVSVNQIAREINQDPGAISRVKNDKRVPNEIIRQELGRLAVRKGIL